MSRTAERPLVADGDRPRAYATDGTPRKLVQVAVGVLLQPDGSFLLTSRPDGKVYAGLTKRRAEESALYLTPEPDDVSAPIAPAMPQRIDPESTMTESPINRAGVVAGGTAAVATVAETARTVADVKYSTQALGDWLVPVLLIVVVALCGFMVWQRIRQRREGWA